MFNFNFVTRVSAWSVVDIISLRLAFIDKKESIKSSTYQKQNPINLPKRKKRKKLGN